MSTLKKVFLIISFLIIYYASYGQETIYDESRVPTYELPDPLLLNNGKRVSSVEEWMNVRRPELMKIFRHEVFGHEPKRPSGLHFELHSENRKALDGKATMKEVKIWLDKKESHYIMLLMYIPNERTEPAPTFLGINFKGNHTTTFDETVTLPTKEQIQWYGNQYEFYDRGFESRRWPIEYLIDHGYGCASFCMSDVDPDYFDDFQNGVHGMFDKGKRDSTSWASISAWAWGLSRAMDYLETDDDIDAKKVVVHGHSRLGKTALWAGAIDQRFAVVISNCSGCSGAAISRRKYGETVKKIQTSFPHWFCRNYQKYSDKEETLPIDQHELLALIAPRPLYVASRSLDHWADPKGEFLGIVNASPVYELFGFEGIKGTELPEANSPITTDRLGYHLGTGYHDIRLYDFEQYVKFADQCFYPHSPKESEIEKTAFHILSEEFKTDNIKVNSAKLISVYSPYELLKDRVEICRKLKTQMSNLKEEYINTNCESKKILAEAAIILKNQAHHDRDNITWNTLTTPTQSLGKNWPSFPRPDYRDCIQVSFEVKGFPRKEYIYIENGKISYLRSDLLKMYAEYTALQDTIDQTCRYMNSNN